MKTTELFENRIKLIDMKINGKAVLLKGKIRNKWTGNFDIPDRASISSLEGCPKVVEGFFSCGRLNPITSLEGGPEKVGRSFDCSQLQLTSLEGGPKEVNVQSETGFGYECFDNKLTSLVGVPDTVYKLNASENKINTLEGIPLQIKNSLLLYDNKLTNLHNINQYIKYIGDELVIYNNPITSHVLGVLKIKGLKSVQARERFPGAPEASTPLVLAIDIINKHLKGDRDILDCQEELIEAGLEDFAQL